MARSSLFFCGCALVVALLPQWLTGQNIPVIGKSGELEIANWNIEWFGDSFSGPNNEALQQKNVATVIQKSDMDVWGLCEVSDATAWDTLLARLPSYGGVISTWSQTQKTALLYRKSLFDFLYQKNILSAYYTDFASGRLPLEVGLLYHHNSKTDTLYFFVIHLKANVGTTTDKQNAYDRRKSSSEALKGYLDTFSPGKKCIVIGDWNDDVDVSIFNFLQTPFVAFVSDSTHYFYPTKRLSALGEQSTVAYTEMIDHQCMTMPLKKYFITDSCAVFRVDHYISGYDTSTSDHFPVYSRYNFDVNSVSVLQGKNSAQPVVFWNGEHLQLYNEMNISNIEIYDLKGMLLWQGKNPEEFNAAPGNLYVVVAEKKEQIVVNRIFVP